ncbi:MAG: hypothetical protein R2684_01380 [Pyrinomonadaceae bacterium]
MFTVKALHTETGMFRAELERVRGFFCEATNFSSYMPNISEIWTDNRGVMHWKVATQIPFVGNFSEKFPIVRTENSDERVEWSPHTEEERNLMRVAADFFPESNQKTQVRLSHAIELRRRSPTELHLLAGFAGETAISNEMSNRIGDMIRAFFESARNRLE